MHKVSAAIRPVSRIQFHRLSQTQGRPRTKTTGDYFNPVSQKLRKSKKSRKKPSKSNSASFKLTRKCAIAPSDFQVAASHISIRINQRHSKWALSIYWKEPGHSSLWMRASGITWAKISMFPTWIEHVVTQPDAHCSLERCRQTDCIYYKVGRHQRNWCQAPSFLKSLLTSSSWVGVSQYSKRMSENISITAYDTDPKVTKEPG